MSLSLRVKTCVRMRRVHRRRGVSCERLVASIACRRRRSNAYASIARLAMDDGRRDSDGSGRKGRRPLFNGFELFELELEPGAF